jgi:aerotolerance regulator-like protein
MNALTFANPWGFLALLGVPAILAIHFLQRESRRVVSSTLFLLEQLSPVSARGRRIERLRNSIPLWLQLLAVLLLAWLLAQPRWLRKDSTQRVIAVLDSSVSMTAFREPMLRALRDRLTTLSRAAAHNEWMLLESDAARGTLYSGGDLSALFAALEKWKPHLGSHDPSPSLRVAQGLLRGNGLLVFVTDHRAVVPDGVELLAVGDSFDNCGFAGLRVAAFSGEPIWQALVKNYGRSPQKRSWWIESGGEKTGAEEIVLQPGQARELQGRFPSGAEKCELCLSGDRFALDDRMPVIRPQPKRLKISADKSEAFDNFFDRFLGSIEAIDRVNSGADVRLLTLDPAAPRVSSGHAIVFFQQPDEPAGYLSGPVIAETHPLAAELNWQGLVCKDTRPIAPQPRDQVLVWQGERALMFLRGDGADRSLVLNFDLRFSNADRLPAFVILLHRFVETIRAEKISLEKKNVETNQLLVVAFDPAGPKPRIANRPGALPILRAPDEPGFFEVAQNDTTLLSAAAHFADAREADFREAAAFDGLQDKAAKLVEKNSERDFLAPVWALLLGLVCFANWGFGAKTT